MNVSSGILVMAMIGAVTAQRSLAGQSDWDRPAAAQYLDDRINLWFLRATQLQTGGDSGRPVSLEVLASVFPQSRPRAGRLPRRSLGATDDVRPGDRVRHLGSFVGGGRAGTLSLWVDQ